MTARPTLAGMLRRGHWQVASVTLLLFGLLLGVIGHAVLGSMQARHLELLARTTGYSIEAAVVFRDLDTIHEVLRPIVQRERLGRLRVVLPDGQLLTELQRPEPTGLAALQAEIGRRLMPGRAEAPVLDGSGRVIAQVELDSEGSDFIQLLLWGSGAGLLCVLLTLGVASLMTRRLERSIVEPIDRLAALTRSIRCERAFDRRAPAAPIAELNALGEDFNAMLAEIDQHHRHLQQDRDRLSQRAWHDALTGLANRARFEQRLEQALQVSLPQGQTFGVLYLDADGFKAVNDTAGHAAGDRLLVQMGERLRAVVREDDLVARLGGDEFAVLLQPLRQVDDARRIAREIGRAMQRPFDLGEAGSFRCGLSAGIATFPQDGDTIPALLDTADRAMYRAKQAGRQHRRPLSGRHEGAAT
ncbi:hypothetical protein X805_01610 [Sphaerotilus natans subsp. natans DSM 6575]|uniref:Diguanylate cyclase n=1 Tax=Sphaerotilus natans subsp. natans DSM 6575 TaxID=1286631 RepID=A0A059KSH8_9BURK|nr:sensor domain-containing diguanylate cyclase [Sphaerotilus natans]KDB54179.1 hypothetical protein X805_01610 [Sphaerotilus natans subsp. natans DSM 6575]SIQ20504.1 diguanylate cyclase (GGDEF) domain-containing protein [Sphaerotilus natans]